MNLVQGLEKVGRDRRRTTGTLLKSLCQTCLSPSLWARLEEVMTWEAVGLGLKTWECLTFLQETTIGPFRRPWNLLLLPSHAVPDLAGWGTPSEQGGKFSLLISCWNKTSPVQRSQLNQLQGERSEVREERPCIVGGLQRRDVLLVHSVRQQCKTTVGSDIKARSVLVGWNLPHDSWTLAQSQTSATNWFRNMLKDKVLTLSDFNSERSETNMFKYFCKTT